MSNRYESKKRKKKNKKQQSKNPVVKENLVQEPVEQLSEQQIKEREEQVIKLEIEKRNQIKAEQRKRRFNSFVKKIPLIVCILIIVSTIVTVSFALVRQCALKDYDDYSQYSLSFEKEILRQDEDSYYVYFYQETCSSCNSIKKNVFQYIEKYNEDDDETTPKLYLFKISAANSIVGSTSNLTGVSDYKNLVVSGTPTLILITNKTVQSSYENAKNIYNQIKK